MYNLLKKHRRAFNAANNNFGAANIVSRQLKNTYAAKSRKNRFRRLSGDIFPHFEFRARAFCGFTAFFDVHAVHRDNGHDGIYTRLNTFASKGKHLAVSCKPESGVTHFVVAFRAVAVKRNRNGVYPALKQRHDVATVDEIAEAVGVKPCFFTAGVRKLRHFDHYVRFVSGFAVAAENYFTVIAVFFYSLYNLFGIRLATKPKVAAVAYPVAVAAYAERTVVAAFIRQIYIKIIAVAIYEILVHNQSLFILVNMRYALSVVIFSTSSKLKPRISAIFSA